MPDLFNVQCRFYRATDDTKQCYKHTKGTDPEAYPAETILAVGDLEFQPESGNWKMQKDMLASLNDAQEEAAP